MRIINAKDLEIIKKINYGNFSDIFLVSYCGKKYCYKHFTSFYEDILTIDRLGEFTEEKMDKHFITPLYMVENSSGFRIVGYLTHYDKNLVDIEDCYDRKEQIILLKSIKEKIEILHNDIGIIHGDIHLSNVLCDKEKLDIYLIDFDLSMPIGERPYSKLDYSSAAIKFWDKFGFTEDIDKYVFNYATFELLANIDESFSVSYNLLKEGNYNIPETNSDVKRLCKELLLDDFKKGYSGEYIIDYID